jgi:hypothetical protein
MSIPSSYSGLSTAQSRRSVLLGLAAFSLPAPAIVRVSSLMPVRRVLITEDKRPWAGYVERLFYNALASGLRRGQITVRLNGMLITWSEAERLVHKARQNGWVHGEPAQPGPPNRLLV